MQSTTLKIINKLIPTIMEAILSTLSDFQENGCLFTASEADNQLANQILMNQDSYNQEAIDAAISIHMSYNTRSRYTKISMDEINICKNAVK